MAHTQSEVEEQKQKGTDKKSQPGYKRKQNQQEKGYESFRSCSAFLTEGQGSLEHCTAQLPHLFIRISQDTFQTYYQSEQCMYCRVCDKG